MRKLLLTVVASCAVVALVPATALAHGHHHSRGHHARVHHKTFGSDFSQSGSSTSGSTSTSSGDTAGTVQSFSNGVLTILLNDQKTTVTGQVTSATEMECQAPQTSSTSSSSGWQGHDGGGWGGDSGGNSSQGGDNSASAQSCDTSALTPGTVVREAELAVSSAGAVWGKIELMAQPSSASTSSASSSSGQGSCNGD